jgi:hypothetical protein
MHLQLPKRLRLKIRQPNLIRQQQRKTRRRSMLIGQRGKRIPQLPMRPS